MLSSVGEAWRTFDRCKKCEWSINLPKDTKQWDDVDGRNNKRFSNEQQIKTAINKINPFIIIRVQYLRLRKNKRKDKLKREII